jgi:uncharacterized protein
MTVCLDTNVFLQIFGRRQPFQPILRALLDGRITLAVSTEILLEYQEIITRLCGKRFLPPFGRTPFESASISAD